jgi:RND family efflux transporter MFP subunit
VKLSSFLSVLPVLLASPFVIALLPACSHDHHDHEPQAKASEPEPLRHLHFGKQVMLFLEHPPLVKSQSARFLAHFSMVDTGDPVRAGRVQVLLGQKQMEVVKPAREGLFIPEGAGEASGKQQLRVVLENATLREEFDLGLVDVHASADLVPASAEDAAGDSVGFLLEQQWSVGLLVRAAGEGQVRMQREFPGVLEFDDNAKAFISAGVSGLFVANDGQPMPRVGERIEKGTQLGWIEPLLSGNDAAQMRVWELEARLSEQDAAHDLERARVLLALAEREQTRIGGAMERGLVTQAQQDQAQTAVTEARLNVDAATLRQASLKGREALRSALRVPVTAPISGMVSEWAAVPGAQVQSGDRLAQLVDPHSLRVRMRIPEEALGSVDRWQSLEISSVLLDSDPVLVERGNLVLTAEVEPTTRTLSALLRPRHFPSTWKPGLLLSVSATETLKTAAVTVPADAIVMDQGMATVYVMLGGEQFQRRIVKLGSRDAQRAEILAGVIAGERVVTRGAHFVRLASMAPEGFGHGHAH